MERHPGFFAGLCFINPEHSIAFVQAEISRCVNEWGFSGVKLEASVKATSSRLNPVMEAVHSLGVFVLHHAWYNVNGTLEAESTPADIADLASRFPDVRILMAHLGGARVRGVRDIENYPNVSVDTSGSQPTSGLVEFAVHVLGRDRVVFGSDVPGRDFSAQLGRVLGARISEEDRARILAGNAVELLKRAEVVP